MARNAKGTRIEPVENGTITPGTFNVKIPRISAKGERLEGKELDVPLTVETNNIYTVLRAGDTDIFFFRQSGLFAGLGTEPGVHQTDPDGTLPAPKPRPKATAAGLPPGFSRA